MTDRDRLAADLHPTTCWNNEFGCGGPTDHVEEADRLIALGWTQPTGDPIGICQLRCGHDGLHDTEPLWGPLGDPFALDEERLARALASIEGDFVGKGSMWTYRAAAIAKAYREDTDG